MLMTEMLNPSGSGKGRLTNERGPPRQRDRRVWSA